MEEVKEALIHGRKVTVKDITLQCSELLSAKQRLEKVIGYRLNGRLLPINKKYA